MEVCRHSAHTMVAGSLIVQFAFEFVFAIIQQLMDRPPEAIVHKSLEVLAIITIPEEGEDGGLSSTRTLSGIAHPPWLAEVSHNVEPPQFPMTESSVSYAFNIIEPARQKLFSRNREVFSALVQLHAHNEDLVGDLSNLITFMCKMQPPEFVFVSFCVEIDRFMAQAKSKPLGSSAQNLKFAASFIRHLCHVLFNTDEAKPLRIGLKDCICFHAHSERDRQRSRLFHILLHSFSHNLASTLTLCFWAGAYRTAHMFLNRVDPLGLNLIFFLEIDRFVEMLERPLFRHLHIRMVEGDGDPSCEGSGSMLFQTLKSLLMILPQSTCYFVLKDRLVSVSRYRQSAIESKATRNKAKLLAKEDAGPFLDRVLHVHAQHCAAAWEAIRAESLEVPSHQVQPQADGSSRHEWLGYASNEAAQEAQEAYRQEKGERKAFTVEHVSEGYDDLASIAEGNAGASHDELKVVDEEPQPAWKQYWEERQAVDL